MTDAREYFLKLEENLMFGGGRWLADFNESFWDYTVDGMTFAMFLQGGMRPKGFALSRIASTLLMPQYEAACFACVDDPALNMLPARMNAVRRYLDKQEIQWAFLVIAGEGEFKPQARARVEKNEENKLGIALVELPTRKITTNQSFIGRRMGRYVSTFK